MVKKSFQLQKRFKNYSKSFFQIFQMTSKMFLDIIGVITTSRLSILTFQGGGSWSPPPCQIRVNQIDGLISFRVRGGCVVVVAPFYFIVNQSPNAWILIIDILDLEFRLDNNHILWLPSLIIYLGWCEVWWCCSHSDYAAAVIFADQCSRKMWCTTVILLQSWRGSF